MTLPRLLSEFPDPGGGLLNPRHHPVQPPIRLPTHLLALDLWYGKKPGQVYYLHSASVRDGSPSFKRFCAK